MIEDAHERTRAILWLLADYDPGMPVLTALGYLRAVESELSQLEAGVRPGQDDARLLPEYRGSRGVPNLVRDCSSVAGVVNAARRGDKKAVAQAIVRHFGPGKVGATEALLAADSLVNMFDSSPAGGSGGMPGPFIT